jgi:hypothetical protein
MIFKQYLTDDKFCITSRQIIWKDRPPFEKEVAKIQMGPDFMTHGVYIQTDLCLMHRLLRSKETVHQKLMFQCYC